MWTYNYSSTELYHHGILGMKWGVHRTAKQLGNDHQAKMYKLEERAKRKSDNREETAFKVGIKERKAALAATKNANKFDVKERKLAVKTEAHAQKVEEKEIDRKTKEAARAKKIAIGLAVAGAAFVAYKIFGNKGDGGVSAGAPKSPKSPKTNPIDPLKNAFSKAKSASDDRIYATTADYTSFNPFSKSAKTKTKTSSGSTKKTWYDVPFTDNSFTEKASAGKSYSSTPAFTSILALPAPSLPALPSPRR